MKVLVIGGTGTAGREVTSALLARNASVRVVTRSQERSDALPYPVSGVVADLNEPETLRPAMSGVDAMFLVTPHSITETGQGVAAVQLAVAAGVKRIVFLSMAMPAGATRIPHVASKAPIEHALITSRSDYTILRTTDWFQNDARYGDAVPVFGVYPHPVGRLGVSRVDVRDVADAALNALTRSGHERRIYTLFGPQPLTGGEIAAMYARCLDREVRYGGDEPYTWEATAWARSMQRWQRNDYRALFRFLQENGMAAGSHDLVEQERVVGHEPRRFADYAALLCSDWNSADETSSELVSC